MFLEEVDKFPRQGNPRHYGGLPLLLLALGQDHRHRQCRIDMGKGAGIDCPAQGADEPEQQYDEGVA